MPLVTSKRAWTQQPDRLLPLDPAVMHEESSLVLLPGVNVQATRVSPLGREIHAADNYYYTDKAPIAQANALTLVMCGRITSAVIGNYSRWVSIGGYGVGNGIDIQQAGSEYIIVYNPGLAHLADKNWMDVEIGNPHTWVAVLNESTVALYRDGKSIWSGAATTAPADTGKVSLFSTPDSPGNNRSDNFGLSLFAVDFGHALGPSEALALSSNAFKIFSPQDKRIWIPSAGGGGLSLTGSLTGQGSTLSGAATNTEVHALSGALVGAGATLSGAATRIYSLTGSLTGQGATISASATNTEVHAISGVLVGAGATLSGTATRIYSLAGALTGQGATLSGSATTLELHAATGALVGAGSTLAATATNTEIHAATGSLIGSGATLSGSATHTPVGINASGSLVGQGATLSATATNTEVHTCTGSLYGQGSALSGALTRVFSASGSLVGAGSTLSATASNAVALFSATGALVGQGSTLTGSATNTETHAVFGALVGQGSTLSATAALANLHTLSGSLVGSGSSLVGYASGPTTSFDAPPDAIVTVINKRNRVSVISRRS